MCNATNLLDVFVPGSYDVVISTEMIEHVYNWRKVVSNLKALAAPGGLIYISTRSRGFPYHAYPYDFWRFEIEDMHNIFSDCVADKVEKDPELGVFAKFRKATNFKENDLSSYELYSIIADKRVSRLDKVTSRNFYRAQEKRKRLSALKTKINPMILVKSISGMY